MHTIAFLSAAAFYMAFLVAGHYLPWPAGYLASPWHRVGNYIYGVGGWLAAMTLYSLIAGAWVCVLWIAGAMFGVGGLGVVICYLLDARRERRWRQLRERDEFAARHRREHAELTELRQWQQDAAQG